MEPCGTRFLHANTRRFWQLFKGTLSTASVVCLLLGLGGGGFSRLCRLGPNRPADSVVAGLDTCAITLSLQACFLGCSFGVLGLGKRIRVGIGTSLCESKSGIGCWHVHPDRLGSTQRFPEIDI